MKGRNESCLNYKCNVKENFSKVLKYINILVTVKLL